jgi:hypothetical protein
MDIRRVEGSYDQYRITATSAELRAIRDGLVKAPGAESDEMVGAIDWYLDRLPRPGETKDEAKDRLEREEGDEMQPIGPEDKAVEAEADRLLGQEQASLPGGAAPGGEDIEIETDEVDEILPEPPTEKED